MVATDTFIVEHRPTNESVIRALEANKLEIFILHFSGYFNFLNDAALRDQLINPLDIQQSVNKLLEYEEQLASHVEPYKVNHGSNILLNAEKCNKAIIIEQVEYALNHFHCGQYKDDSLMASEIDVGLSCKSSLSRIYPDIPEYKLLIASLVYQNLALSYLSSIQLKYNYIIQNSQYALNYAIYQYALCNHIQHRFYEGHQLYRNSISLYACPIHDIFVRRRHAASSLLIQNFGTGPYSFANDYLDKRIVKSYSHVYSPLSGPFADKRPEDVLGFSKFVVFFTSSPDEYSAYAAQIKLSQIPNIKKSTRPFSSESEFLNDLAALTKECQIPLVIRMHPRLGADHRGTEASPYLNDYLQQLMKLNEKYKHIRIILPFEKISSYWLALWASSICAFRGTIACEMALLGLSTNLGIINDGVVNTTMPALYNIKDSYKLLANVKAEIEHGHPIMSASHHKSILQQFYITHCLNRINLPKTISQEDLLLPPGSPIINSIYSHFNQCLRFGSSIPDSFIAELDFHENDRDNYVEYLASIKRLVSSAVSIHSDCPFNHSLKSLFRSRDL